MTGRLPRSLHPLAWWLWALAMAVAASRTTNPLLLGAVLGVVCWVVLARRPDAPWANAFRLYLWGGVAVVSIRMVFRVVFGGDQGAVVLVPLPRVPLPHVLGGVRLFGDVTAESLLGGLYDGMRLATMLICLGAANALANPRRLLRSMPPAMHEVSTAVVVALSVFPQLAESVVRVRRARRLRPTAEGSRIKALRMIVIPVLEDALDRSMLLAASMDSRGYGRTGSRSRRAVWATGALMLAGMTGICVSAYALLDATAPRVLAAPLLICSSVLGISGIAASGRGVVRTAYRPDRWRSAELVVVASGVAAVVLVWLASGVAAGVLNPSLNPLVWPQVSVLALAGVLVGLLPAFTTPLPAFSGSPGDGTDPVASVEYAEAAR
jgi:energy-coupling factor transport system permease protein